MGYGFQYFYGFVGGDASQWQPNLFRNTTPIAPYQGHPGWNLITAMADDAIDYLRNLNATSPDQPFFVYYAPGGTHAPHHPKPEWIDKFRGRFDMGWNALRDQIFANQKKLGAIPENAKLTPWPQDLPTAPTVLEACGIAQPQSVDGIAQRPMEGVSMAYTWDKANAAAPTRHTTQYFEMFGSRAVYHDGWIAAAASPVPPWDVGTKPPPDVTTFSWELYRVADDWTENDDLARREPGKLKELQQLFTNEAAKYNVFPLDDTFASRALTPRPGPTAGRNVFTYTGEVSHVAWGAAPNVWSQSYTITASVEVPVAGAQGMIVTSGGRFGGYGLYLLQGRPVYTYNLLGLASVRWEGPDALTPGKHTLVFDFKYDGGGLGKGGQGTLRLDGKDAATKRMDKTIPLLLEFDNEFNAGLDTQTAVAPEDYEPPFRFTGTLDKVVIELLGAADGAQPALRRRLASDAAVSVFDLAVFVLAGPGPQGRAPEAFLAVWTDCARSVQDRSAWQGAIHSMWASSTKLTMRHRPRRDAAEWPHLWGVLPPSATSTPATDLQLLGLHAVPYRLLTGRDAPGEMP